MVNSEQFKQSMTTNIADRETRPDAVDSLAVSTRPARLELSTYYGLALSLDDSSNDAVGESPVASVTATGIVSPRETVTTEPSKQLVQQVLERASISELLTQAKALQTQALDSETALQRTVIRLFEDYDDTANWCSAQADILAELRRSLHESQKSLETATDQCKAFTEHSADLEAQLDLTEGKLRVLQIIRIAGAAVPEFRVQLAEGRYDAVAQQYVQIQEALLQLDGVHALFGRLRCQLEREIGSLLEQEIQHRFDEYVRVHQELVQGPEQPMDVLASAASATAAAFRAGAGMSTALERIHGRQRVGLVDRARNLLEQGFQMQQPIPARCWEGLVQHLLAPIYALVQENDPAAPEQVENWAPVWQRMIRQTWLEDPSPPAVQAIHTAVSSMPPDWQRILSPVLSSLLEAVWIELLTSLVLPSWRECLTLLADASWSMERTSRVESLMMDVRSRLEQKLCDASDSLDALLHQDDEQTVIQPDLSRSPRMTNAQKAPLQRSPLNTAARFHAVLTTLTTETWLRIQQGAPLSVAFLLLESLEQYFEAEAQNERSLANTYVRLRTLQATRRLHDERGGPNPAVISVLSDQLAQEAALATCLSSTRNRTRTRHNTTTEKQESVLACTRYTEQVQRNAVALSRYWQRLALVATRSVNQASTELAKG